MAWLSGVPFWSFVVLVSAFLGTDSLVVKYPKAYLVGTVGQSLTLTCKTEFDSEKCKQVDVNWCHKYEEKCSNLIDTQKYLTLVNETRTETFRERHVVTEFLRLTPEDEGLFQCIAKCRPHGEEAKGHYINITVKAKPRTEERKPNNAGLNAGYQTRLIVWSLLLIWGY